VTDRQDLRFFDDRHLVGFYGKIPFE